MELVEVSGTISDKDQTSYIKIETLRGKNQTEIHRALSDPRMTLECPRKIYIHISKTFCILSVADNNED